MVHCGINPEYVRYEMSFIEAEYCIEAYFEKYQNTWEQTRRIMHMTAQSHASKVLKLTDIITFPWDKKDPKIKTSKLELERLKKQGELISKLLTNDR